MNVLFITSDQHRADCLGIAGHPCIQTPNLDRLAVEGTVFDAAYSDCPVCIPARTTLITGRQAHHNGCPAYREGFRITRDPSTLLARSWARPVTGRP
jgi:arylsulfatase A-like enzyme